MLIIDNATVTEILTMKDCIRVQEEAFRKLPEGGAIHRPRIDMYFPCDRDDGYFRWGSMEGANDGYFAIRMKSDIIYEMRQGDVVTQEKYCVQPGTFCGLIFLTSIENGEPLAFINDGVLQHMRVAGDGGIGVKYMAKADAKVVGMLGSGGMVVLDETTDMVKFALRIMRFYQHESCGWCIPCREGTTWLRKVLQRFDDGGGRQEDIPLIGELAKNMFGRTFCALGDAAAMPTMSIIEKFRGDFEKRLAQGTI